MTDTFVTPSWLSTNREEVVIVDVRHDWEYDEGHIPGAVNVQFEDVRDPTDETPGKLPTPEDFSTRLADRGIEFTDQIVAYDGEFGVYASRFLITAEVFGHEFEKLHLLNGDFQAWEREYPVSMSSPAVTPSNYVSERIADGLLIGADELNAALETDAVIVDTRDPLEYDTVHIPGAVNFQWRDLVDESQRRLKSPEQCREIFSEHGIHFDRPVRLYCNTARRLSFVYMVLRDLGHDDVAFYEGGIDAWAKYGGEIETST